jgi:putative thioredoxin
MPTIIDEQNFQKEVIDVSFEIPVLIDFWAEWCGPCKMLSPVLDKLEKEYKGSFKLGKVNTDENQQLSAIFRISSIPDVKLIKDGKIKDQFVGALPEKQIRDFLDKHVDKSKLSDPWMDLATNKPLELLKKIKESKEAPENREELLWTAFVSHLISTKKYEEAINILSEIPDEASGFSNQRNIVIEFLKDNPKEKTNQLFDLKTNPKKKNEILDFFLKKVEDSPYNSRSSKKNDLLACFYFLEQGDEDLFLYRKKLSSLLF